MVGVEVAVRDDSDQDLTRPADLTVIRWVIDPALGLDLPPDATGATDESGQTGQGGAQSGATGQPSSSSGAPNGRM